MATTALKLGRLEGGFSDWFTTAKSCAEVVTDMRYVSSRTLARALARE